VRLVFEKEPDCPARRIDAFCKLLDDVSVYDRDRGKKAAALRRQVFRLAAPSHPLVQKVDRLFDHSEADVKADIARQLNMTWQEIDDRLFADVFDYHRLKEFSGYARPGELLSRYNVAQVQAALYRAVDMTVWAKADFKTIMRYAKLARLLHTIKRDRFGGYQVRFDGPVSLLRHTRRYGVSLARFLPALIACRDWRMHARIAVGRKKWQVSLNLTSRDGLKSHFPALDEFDSGLEQAFAEKWGEEKRNGWSLVREGEMLHRGQKVFFPDFLLRHEDGRSVHFEIVGFWTPEYLREKLATLETFKDENILLAVSEALTEKCPQLPGNVITFKSALLLKDVLDRLA
jgi:predicted nuclease of restriction endonuclease-like RecB superfamily